VTFSRSPSGFLPVGPAAVGDKETLALPAIRAQRGYQLWLPVNREMPVESPEQVVSVIAFFRRCNARGEPGETGQDEKTVAVPAVEVLRKPGATQPVAEAPIPVEPARGRQRSVAGLEQVTLDLDLFGEAGDTQALQFGLGGGVITESDLAAHQVRDLQVESVAAVGSEPRSGAPEGVVPVPQVIFHRQLKVNRAAPIATVVEAIEFTDGPSALPHRQVMGEQVNGGILGQEEVPEALEIDPEARGGTGPRSSRSSHARRASVSPRAQLLRFSPAPASPALCSRGGEKQAQARSLTSRVWKG
jgi:hypothetical protein